MMARAFRRINNWSGWVLGALALASAVLGGYGFYLYLDPGTGGLEIGYQTLQLFFVNFNKINSRDIPWPLELARFGAFLTAVFAIVKALFPQFIQWLRLKSRGWGRGCALILGYGPVGQAIGTALGQGKRGRWRITAVHPGVTAEMAARARNDGVLLIEGDPSDAKTLKDVSARRAERIYVSDTDDMRAIDTAVAVRRFIENADKDVRVVLNESAVARHIAEASPVGFLGAPGLRWFSLADETARLLIAEARFDRFALESGAERMHLAIIGCGSLGEAIAAEALLTGWRVGLAPPKITFLDRDIEAIEARMRRRLPAWFAQADGAAIYPAARPILEFLTCDGDGIDFAHAGGIDGLRERVSGWVLAMGNDALNVRASVALHRAIMARRIDPAPIYVRIPTGHLDEAPDLSTNPLGLVRTFGSVDTVVDQSPFLAADPDDVPRKLHAAYLKAEREMFERKSEDWEHLPETKREANRALARHAVMKIEDFGGVAARDQNGVPVAHAGLAETLRRVDASLDYAAIDQGPDARGWLKPGATLGDEDLEAAVRVRDAAICEHNRWTMERALARFVPTAHPDRALRDDVRRLHDNMHDWFTLGEAQTRRNDLVMLLALLTQHMANRTEAHQRAHARTIFLAVDGQAGTCEAHTVGGTGGMDEAASELHVHLNVHPEPRSADGLVACVVKCLRPHAAGDWRRPPLRIRFDFLRLPSERTLELANLVARTLQQNLCQTARIDSFWNWRCASETTVGVVGHRDLSAFGGTAQVTQRLRQTLMELITHRGVNRMVSGYAPGTDRAAVAAWSSLRVPKPRLIFPFALRDAQGRRLYYTEEAAQATADTTVAEATAQELGLPELPGDGTGHAAQARAVLRQADILVFVADESRPLLDGGTLETLRHARDMRRDLVVLAPDAGAPAPSRTDRAEPHGS